MLVYDSGKYQYYCYITEIAILKHFLPLMQNIDYRSREIPHNDLTCLAISEFCLCLSLNEEVNESQKARKSEQIC